MRSLYQASFALLAGLLIGLLHFSSVQARSPDPTVLVIRSQGSIAVGEEIEIFIWLMTVKGTPLFDQVISLYIDGTLAQQQTTDQYGSASFHLQPNLGVGQYTIEIIYNGFPGYQSTEAEIEMTIEPAMVTVQTVPTLSGVVFSLDGVIFQSGHDGIARIWVDKPGSYQVDLVSFDQNRPGTLVTFQVWEPESFEESLVVKIPGTTAIQTGFVLSYLVDLKFVDLDGMSIEPDRVTSVSIRSSDGKRYTLTPEQKYWLPSNSILRRLTGLDSVTVNHSVQGVEVDGSNVVNRGQQRFILSRDGPVQIELLLYSLNISSKDPIFGFPVGDGVTLETPDGKTQYFPFESDGSIQINFLARGAYKARLQNPSGISMPVPIVLSRNQELILPVITFLDIILFIWLFSAAAFSLLIFGRVITPAIRNLRVTPRRERPTTN